jgi:hypothetical protein
MKHYFQTSVLAIGTLICFAEIFLAPRCSDPGPWAAAILAIVLLRRTIITTQQPAIAILAGCILTVLLLAGDHGLLNVNRPAWLGFVVAAGVCYAFWERLERLCT